MAHDPLIAPEAAAVRQLRPQKPVPQLCQRLFPRDTVQKVVIHVLILEKYFERLRRELFHESLPWAHSLTEATTLCSACTSSRVIGQPSVFTTPTPPNLNPSLQRVNIYCLCVLPIGERDFGFTGGVLPRAQAGSELRTNNTKLNRGVYSIQLVSQL